MILFKQNLQTYETGFGVVLNYTIKWQIQISNRERRNKIVEFKLTDSV